ncbi:MAG: aminoacetone oxidase family FAD-binding enzyme [Bacteroidaceae bacterium]|nr:aminoacetone oxidase family FAD-binding enzyme [Bacteroidaceae bacterium]
MRIAIVGGGAAGFFLAVAIKEIEKSHSVTIYESGSAPLRKVKVSGGGRCNISNTFNNVKDLKDVYPRGHKLLKRLFKAFSPEDAQQWWREHGVALTAQEDECIFPVSQSSQTVIDALTISAKRLGVQVLYNAKVESVAALKNEYDAVVLATGGIHLPSADNPLYDELLKLGHEMLLPVPSLFTFSIENERLRELTGVVVEQVEMKVPGTKFRTSGALLITHWGVSGPATLKLSSHAARFLADNNYIAPLSINWLNCTPQEAEQQLYAFILQNPKKEITTCPFAKMQNRLWRFLVSRSMDYTTTTDGCMLHYSSLSKKQINRLIETLTNDTYSIAGRYKHKDEFVTCGGVALSSVDKNSLESKCLPGLYFVGEVLDIDGVTGGFNFQACWTTAMTVARAITRAKN